MSLSYALTFEHDLKPPETVRGDSLTDDADLALKRALRAAEKAFPKYRWSSLVVVLEKPSQLARSKAEPPADGHSGDPA